MGQDEIYELLNKSPGKKYYAKEISKILNIDRNTASDNLRRLRKRIGIGFHYEKDGFRTFRYWVDKN